MVRSGSVALAPRSVSRTYGRCMDELSSGVARGVVREGGWDGEEVGVGGHAWNGRGMARETGVGRGGRRGRWWTSVAMGRGGAWRGVGGLARRNGTM
jgi:hypothetical protein